MAYHAGKKRGQAQDAEPPADEPTAAAQPSTDYAPAPPEDTGPDAADIDQIQKLAELHQSGALTDQEFSDAKAKLLA